jgi:hypothetical protein
MTTATPARLFRGATVYVLDPRTRAASAKFPGPWTVTKINPRTAKLTQPRDGGGVSVLNADKSLCVSEPPSAVVEYRQPWAQGQIVRWPAAPLAKTGGMTLFTVITDDGSPTITRMVTLGNTTGRYWRKIPAADLQPVTVDEILKDGVR